MTNNKHYLLYKEESIDGIIYVGFRSITNLTKKQKIALYRGSVWVDDVQQVNDTTIYTTPTVPLWIFKCHNDNVSKFRLYEFKIYENNILTRYYRPALNSSNVAGLYELMTRQFFSSANTTPFLYG